MGLAFVTGLAAAAATVVAVTAVASLTLLPALLGFAGERIELTRWRGLIAALLVAAGLVGVALTFQPLALVGISLAAVVLLASFAFKPLRREVPRRTPRPLRETVAYRWSRFIQHRPWVAAISGATILLVLAIPFFSQRLAFSDEGNYPEETTTRKAYDLLAAGFGPGFNGPLLLSTEIPEGTDPATLELLPRPWPVTRGRPSSPPRCRTIPKRRRQRCGGSSRRPPRRTNRPPTWCIASATRSCRTRHREQGWTSPSRARWRPRSTSPNISPRVCRSSSVSCSVFPSCC